MNHDLYSSDKLEKDWDLVKKNESYNFTGIFSNQGKLYEITTNLDSIEHLPVSEILVSSDSGKNWKKINNNLPKMLSYEISFCNDYIVLLNSPSGAFITNDNGKKWIEIKIDEKNIYLQSFYRGVHRSP